LETFPAAGGGDFGADFGAGGSADFVDGDCKPGRGEREFFCRDLGRKAGAATGRLTVGVQAVLAGR